MGFRHDECSGPKRHEFDEWRREFDEWRRLGSDPLGKPSPPDDIARASLYLGLMERFNYRSLREIDREDARILYLLEIEDGWGRKRDEREELERQEKELKAHGE